MRYALPEGDGGIDYYRSIDGAHMYERAGVAFAMSSLDTPTYRAYLQERRPASLDSLIVDVGGGDGRNAWPWLEWGYRRVVVVDPILSALGRFRARVAQQHPEWLDRLLLIEGDARHIPLISKCAARVQAIEALIYLNEDYEEGLRECIRLLTGDGELFVSERDYEGGLLTALLYDGLEQFLLQSAGRDVWDGLDGHRVRSRCFTSSEFIEVLERNQLRIVSHRGMSIFSLALGYLRSIGRVTDEDESRLSDVHSLLQRLGTSGVMRRCHVVVAERAEKANEKKGSI